MNTSTTSPISLTGSYTYYNNIPYDKYNRTTIDLFVPTSVNPVGVVMNYHGGGFIVGKKDPSQYDQSTTNSIQNLLDNGIAYAYVNYRLINVDGEKNTLLKSLECGVKSIDFIVNNGAGYNLDTSKICLQGSSAGNGLIMHNIHYGINNVKCLVLQSPQVTYDPLENILTDFGFDIIQDIETYTSSRKDYLRGVGVKNISDLTRPNVVLYRNQVNYLNLPVINSPTEAFIETLNQPTPLDNNSVLVTHHYRHCELIQTKLQSSGTTCLLNIPTAPGVVSPGETKENFILRNIS